MRAGMARLSSGEGSRGWIAVSDLADHVYCPRARYYRRHHPGEARSAEERRRLDAGRRYHDTALGAVREAERLRPGPWIAAGAALLLLALLLRWRL